MRSTEPPTDRAAPRMRPQGEDGKGREEEEVRPRESVGKEIEGRRSRELNEERGRESLVGAQEVDVDLHQIVLRRRAG